jgi:type I restriction enzyme S subunit
MGYTPVPIGDCVAKITTWNPRQESGAEDFLYVDLSSVNKDTKSIVPENVSTVFPAEAPSRARQIIASGDVLVSTVRPNLNGVALVPNQFDGATASTGYCVLRPNPSKLDSKYLFYWVQNPRFVELMIKQATGANYPAVSDRVVKSSEIPLPPLAEQKRIAAILDKADALRRKRQQAIDLADQFLRSVFLEMFGDPVTNPKGFAVRTLKEFYCDPKQGTKCGPFGSALKKEEYQSDGVPVWNMDNISLSGEFKDSPSLWVSPEKYDELIAYSVESGDVIISRAGTVGKMGVVRSKYLQSLISTNLIRVRFGPQLRPEYFVALMTYCKGRVGRLKTGPDGSFTHMNTGILDSLEFPYPPLEVQERYLKVREQVLAGLAGQMTVMSELDELFSSISQHAFSGQL